MTVDFSYMLLHSMCSDAIFVKVYEENSASHRYVVGKGRSILITFADNYSSLILHKNSTNGSFLKVNAGRIWNHINELSIYCYIKIQSSCTLNRYLTHLIHTDYLENIGSLSYANITNVETFYVETFYAMSKKSRYLYHYWSHWGKA